MAKNNLESFLKNLEKEKTKVKTQEADYLKRVKNLIGPFGQSFSTLIYSFQYVEEFKSLIYFLRSTLLNELEEEQIKKVTFLVLNSNIKSFRVRYEMTDTADILEDASKLVSSLDKEKLEILFKNLLEYINYLDRGIRTMIPFYELSLTYEGVKLAEKVENIDVNELRKKREELIK
jgi:hypothetical protein